MEDILARARKVAEEAEVFTVSSEQTPIQFEANRLKHIQTRQSASTALRIIRHGRLGYAATTGLEADQDLVDMAVETAQFGMPAEFELPPSTTYPEVEVFDSEVESVPLETMVKLGEEMVAAVTAHTSGIMCEAGVTRSTASVSIKNSRGGEAGYKISVFSLGVMGTLVRDTDMLFVGESDTSCHPIARSQAIIDEVIQQLELAKDLAAVPTRTMPVIFTPRGVASALIAPLMSAFNGKTVLQGASPIGNRMGEPVFDEHLSLWDDPTVAYSPASRPCDDEGVPSQRTPLIEEGTVAGFLYDLQTAAQSHTRSTGSGRRSHGGQPAPSPSAFVISPGNTTFDEMVSNTREGLIIEELMGATQGNVLGGDFSGNVLLGYKIENGKITGRVKNTMVSGNIYQVLRQIVAIGKEPRWIGGFLHTPHLFCPNLSVASKG